MLTPVVAERPAQPYVAISAQATMQTLGDILPPLHPQVFAWLRERGIPVAGPPFWKFNVIDMERFLEVEVGVPGDLRDRPRRRARHDQVDNPACLPPGRLTAPDRKSTSTQRGS